MSAWFGHRRWLNNLSVATVLLFSSGSMAWADVGPASMDELMKMNKELMSQVSELTKRVTQLEGQVAARERAAAPIPVAPVPPEGGVVRTPGTDIRLSGFIDTSFNWNFVTPNVAPGGTNSTGNSTLRAFDRESDTFDLNNAQITFERPAPEAGGAGFKTEFTYGTDAQVIESTGFLGGTDEFSIQEAYAEIKIPVGTGLTVLAGKFATLHGAEVIENYQNWNPSRSFLFNLAIPFTHTGVRAIYSWLDGKVKTGLGLVNGWDNAIDSNRIKDVEAQVVWTPSDVFSVVTNFMFGSQVVDDRDDNRGLIDVVASWQPLPEELPNLKLMANYDYGFEERLGKGREGGPADWQGYALYAKYDVNDRLAFAARWEQFWDDQGVRTGTTNLNRLWEITYSADYKFYENLLTRFEYRHDHGDRKLAFDSGTEDDQDTLGASLIYLFG